MKNLPDISQWEYENLLDLPSDETDTYEYKSSKTPLDQLKNKISKAASAFWNSGGGILIIGVDNSGRIDGGIQNKNGKQNIRDWIDNAVKLTEPTGDYDITLISRENATDIIEENKIVAVVKFNQSNIVPHMAYDNKYYIRVGAHSDPASHFLIEALRSLRNFSKPNLRGIMKYHPTKPRVEELVIIAVNDAAALDVKLEFVPLPKGMQDHFTKEFPLEIALINKDNPFRMEISLFGARTQAFGEEPIKLLLTYNDVLGNQYYTEQMISPQKNLQPMIIGEDVYVKLVKAIEKLADKLK